MYVRERMREGIYERVSLRVCNACGPWFDHLLACKKVECVKVCIREGVYARLCMCLNGYVSNRQRIVRVKGHEYLVL